MRDGMFKGNGEMREFIVGENVQSSLKKTKNTYLLGS